MNHVMGLFFFYVDDPNHPEMLVNLFLDDEEKMQSLVDSLNDREEKNKYSHTRYFWKRVVVRDFETYA